MHPYVHRSSIYNGEDTEATPMSINRWMDKEGVRYVYIYTHTHTHKWKYIILFKNAILLLATTSMDLDDIMLSEVSQAEKDEYHVLSFICGI